MLGNASGYYKSLVNFWPFSRAPGGQLRLPGPKHFAIRNPQFEILSMSIITEVIQSTRAIIQGMSVTLSYIPKRKQTVQYPEEPVTVQPRYRGQHLLHVDESGKEKCVACFLCAAACPSECIYIEAVDDPRPAAERVGVDERYAKVYNIDYGRCIFCGYCVEACPKDAITHGYNFELSVYNRADLLKTKDDLLITKQVQSKNYRVAFSDEDVDSEYKEV